MAESGLLTALLAAEVESISHLYHIANCLSFRELWECPSDPTDEQQLLLNSFHQSSWSSFLLAFVFF